MRKPNTSEYAGISVGLVILGMGYLRRYRTKRLAEEVAREIARAGNGAK